MFSNSKDKEKQVVKNLVDYQHATHNTIVSNSVGMALLHLYECYLNHIELLERDKEFESLYQCCLSQIKSNAPASSQADCAYLHSLTALELSELDTVTLFFKAQDYASTGNLYSERRIFPLKKVITLVWLALSDQNKYSVYLRAEDPEKRAETLEDHYQERLTSFYNCLARLNQSKICRHGVRNELVFLLNKSYPGIDLIEDSRAAVFYFLKESLLAYFFKSRAEAPELEQKALLHALLIWMRDTNPKVLLGIVDPEYTIIKELAELFIQHGSAPQEIKLEVLIEEALENLTFSCNKLESTFYYLNLILQRPPLKQMHSEVKAGFDFVQNWLFKEFDLDNDAHRRQLVIFSKFYHSYHELHNHYKLLALSGFLTPKLLDYEKILRIYFLRISEYKMLWSTGYLLDLRSIMPRLFSLDRAIKRAKVDKLTDHVENFFCKWFDPSNKTHYDLRPGQYELLISDLFQSKITLTDEQIAELYRSQVEGILNLGPYEINLIFLYAISTPVEKWSMAFGGRYSEVDSRLVEGLFPRVLAFIKSNFNGEEKETSSRLKKGSYPDELIQQLDWLEREYRKYLWDNEVPLDLDPLDLNEPYERPKNRLFLPSQLRTAEDWIDLVDILSRSPNEETVKLWNDIYKSYTVKIHLILERAIKTNKEISFNSCLFSLPGNIYSPSFIQHLIDKKALIHTHHCRDALISAVTMRYPFLTNLLINYCMKYLEKGWEFVLIKNYQTEPNGDNTLPLQHFVYFLEGETKVRLFNHLGTDFAKFLLNRKYLIKYLNESSDEQAHNIVDCIIENKLFLALSTHHSDDGWDKFSSILQAISSPILHKKMMAFMTDHLADLIERLFNLNEFLGLPDIDSDRIDFEKIIDKLKNNFTFSKMLSFFSNNLKLLIIKSLGDSFYNYLHSLEDLLQIFSLFYHDYECIDIFDHFDLNKCSSYLINGKDVNKCLRVLSIKGKARLIAHLGTALRTIVQDKTEFENILYYLALSAIPFIKYFEHNITEFIDNEEILYHVIEAVCEESPSDQLTSFAVLEEPIKNLIKNEKQLNGLLRKMPGQHHVLCLNYLSDSLDLSALDCNDALKGLLDTNQAAIMQYLADTYSPGRMFTY